jgi:hypothetical protein
VALYDLFANGQADTGAGVLFLGMQTLKNLKDVFGILRLKANAIVVDGDQPFSTFPSGRQMNPRGLVVLKPDGIGEEIL